MICVGRNMLSSSTFHWLYFSCGLILLIADVCVREEILLQILKLSVQYDRYVLLSLRETSAYLLYIKQDILCTVLVNLVI